MTKKRFNEVWKELCSYGESGDDLLNRLMDYYYNHRKKRVKNNGTP